MFLLALVLAALIPSWGSALTLHEAVNEGLGHSPEIRKAEAASVESHWKKFEVFGREFLPKLEVNAHDYLNEKYPVSTINFGGNFISLPGFYPARTAAVDLTLPVFDGFRGVRQYQSARLQAEASDKELEHARFELSEKIRLAFYQALEAVKLLSVSEQNVATLQEHFKQVSIKQRGGVATNYDKLRVEVQLSEAKADALDAQDNANFSRRQLTLLLGLNADQRPLVGELPVPNADPIRQLTLPESLPNRGDIQALDLRTEAATHAHQAAETWMVPSIFLSGEYMKYESQIVSGSAVENTGRYQDAYNVGVFLRWNLFDGGAAIAQSAEASARWTEAAAADDAAKLKTPYDFNYWKRRYMSNSDHYLSKTLDVKRSEESVRLAREEERAGTRTSTETLDAELDLFRARAGVLKAQVGAIAAKIHLEMTLGREI